MVCWWAGFSLEMLCLEKYGGGPTADYGSWVLLEKAANVQTEGEEL